MSSDDLLKTIISERLGSGKEACDIYEELIAAGYEDNEVRSGLKSARRLRLKIAGCLSLVAGLVLIGFGAILTGALRSSGSGAIPSGLFGVGALLVIAGLTRLISGFGATDGVEVSAELKPPSATDPKKQVEWVFSLVRSRQENVTKNLGRGSIALLTIFAAGIVLSIAFPGDSVSFGIISASAAFALIIVAIFFVSSKFNYKRWLQIEAMSDSSPMRVVGVELSETSNAIKSFTLMKFKVTDQAAKNRVWRFVIQPERRGDVASALAAAFPMAQIQLK